MSTEHVDQDLVAHLSGNLDPQAEQRVRLHISECDQCREALESLTAFWSEMGKVPDEQPGPALQARFDDMLRQYEIDAREASMTQRSRPKDWLGWLMPWRPLVRFGLIAAVLCIGALGGYWMKSRQENGSEFVQLHDEVRGLSRLLTVSLLQQQSASERLRGVSWSYRLGEPDAEIIDTLIQILKYDPNVNVRLAALDALSRDTDRQTVRQELLESLPRQTSPMVQMAMVDLMVQLHEKGSLDALNRLMNNPKVNDDVRKKLAKSIQELNS